MPKIGPDEGDDFISITLLVFAKSQEEALKVAETLNRVQVGLALDGTSANVTMQRISPTEENTQWPST